MPVTTHVTTRCKRENGGQGVSEVARDCEVSRVESGSSRERGGRYERRRWARVERLVRARRYGVEELCDRDRELVRAMHCCTFQSCLLVGTSAVARTYSRDRWPCLARPCRGRPRNTRLSPECCSTKGVRTVSFELMSGYSRSLITRVFFSCREKKKKIKNQKS
jgi:hypothetical protein